MIAVRKATLNDDLSYVYKIRTTVFVEEQNCPPEIEWEYEDESVHFLATVNDIPQVHRDGEKLVWDINWNALQY
jgi:predicted GNAT family N-acyltransferase